MSRRLLGILGLTTFMACQAAIPTSEDSEGDLMRSEGLVVRHLEPMTQQDFEEFRARKPERPCVVSFDQMDAFGPALHWCIEEHKDGFTIALWESAAAIGAKNSPSRLKVRKISASVAQQIRQIWFLAIVNARYAPVRILSADGVHYYFGVKRYTIFDVLEVHARTPMGDYPPTWIAGLGTKVFESAKSDSLEDAALAKELAEVRIQLEKFYPESQGS